MFGASAREKIDRFHLMFDTYFEASLKCYIHPEVFTCSLPDNPLDCFSGVWKVSSRANEYFVYTK